MKKTITIILLACTLCAAAAAQPRQNYRDKTPEGPADKAEMMQRMESEKIAFYTKAIGLKPEEAEDFWAVYNTVEEDQRALVKAEMDASLALNEAIKAKKSEADVAPLLDAYIKASGENVNLHFKAAPTYRKVLGSVKTAKFFAAQERFRREQSANLRSGRPDGPGQGGPGQRGRRPDGMQGGPGMMMGGEDF